MDKADSLRRLKTVRPVASLRPEKTDWYKITNRADVTEISIYDEIGYVGVTAGDFIRDLDGVKSGKISLRLNSIGGDVFDGIAIMNALKNHSAEVTVHVDGIAASIASVIAMAGDKVIMSRNSQLMIHDAWTVGMGNAKELRKTADLLDKTSDNIASIYAERTGTDVEYWRNQMLEEVWFSAEEAVEAGLADEVAGSTSKPKNSGNLSIHNEAEIVTETAPVVETVETVAEDTEDFDYSTVFTALKGAFGNDH